METELLPHHVALELKPDKLPKFEQEIQTQEHEVQLRLARQVQQKFYRPAPLIPGYDVAAAAYPAHETSGDYYDFIPLPPHHFVIAMGDVEGHGFGSALVMALTRAYVRSFAALALDVAQILTQVNRMLVNDLGDRCLVTMLLASLDVAHSTIVYAGAGHVPGYILAASGAVEQRLESGGMPLGLFPHAQYSLSSPIAISPGQSLVLLTDGILESIAPNGSEWGQDGFLSYLRAHHRETASQLVEGVYEASRNFSGYRLQQDDITSIIIKATG